jgi:glutathione S-transferase
MTLRLFQIEMSPFCDKVRRILHWKRQAYQVTNLKLLETLTRLPRMNPVGKVPTLDHDGTVISDSTDIAHYLEQRFPEPRLLPRAPDQRALCHLLEDWADESLYFYEARLRFTFTKNVARTAEVLLENEHGLMKRLGGVAARRSMNSILAKQGIGRKSEEAVLRDVQRHAEAIAGWLGARDWLVGEALTLADISVFVQLACIRSTDEGDKILAAQPTVLSWMERVDAATRPAP